jgi:hypothetical protein
MPAAAIVRPPVYSAGVIITSDDLTDVKAGYPLFGDDPELSPNAVDSSAQHLSLLGTGTRGSASAGPDSGGTVRATATTADETVGSEAHITYTFQLQAKEGAEVPQVVPLHVFANGSTGSDGYSNARITFILSYYDSPVSNKSIFQDTGVVSGGGSFSTFGGDGNIHIDQDINVLLGRDIIVSLDAYAGAGISVGDQDPYKNEFGTGTAYLDPIFMLPAAYRDLIDIVGVPDNVVPPTDPSGVPEPMSWAMMVGGFGLIGTGMRRRQRVHIRYV